MSPLPSLAPNCQTAKLSLALHTQLAWVAGRLAGSRLHEMIQSNWNPAAKLGRLLGGSVAPFCAPKWLHKSAPALCLLGFLLSSWRRCLVARTCCSRAFCLLLAVSSERASEQANKCLRPSNNQISILACRPAVRLSDWLAGRRKIAFIISHSAAAHKLRELCKLCLGCKVTAAKAQRRRRRRRRCLALVCLIDLGSF